MHCSASDDVMISLHEISCVNTQFKVQSRFDLDIVECVVDFGETSEKRIGFKGPHCDAEEKNNRIKQAKVEGRFICTDLHVTVMFASGFSFPSWRDSSDAPKKK